jgi:serine/threonine-protein phosphatase 6 regulatory ankyrin repeat subunit B
LTPLIIAVVSDDPDIVDDLLSAGASIDSADKRGNTALILAAQNGRSTMVAQLLSKKADPNLQNSQGFTAILLAAYEGYQQVIALKIITVIEAVDLHELDQMYYCHAHYSTLTNLVAFLNLNLYFQTVLELLDADAKVDIPEEDGNTALLMACQNGHTEIARALIDRGADFNLENHKGVTALHKAVFNQKLDIVQLLLDSGADVNKETSEKDTPLHLAIQSPQLDIFQLLVERGANLEQGDIKGWTPLIIAAYMNNLPALKYLLDKGVNIDAQEHIGDTALILAAQEGSKQCVTELLRRNADRTILNNQGMDALARARSNKHFGIVQELQQPGCKAENIFFPVSEYKVFEGKTDLDKAMEKIKEFNLKLDAGSKLPEDSLPPFKELCINGCYINLFSVNAFI